MAIKKHDISSIDIQEIKPYDNNPRVHTSEQIEQIKKSIVEFGFTTPVIVDKYNNLLAGHGRLEAVKQLNKVECKTNPILTIPCVVVNDLSDIQKRALIISDNNIALNSSWDYELLKNELIELEQYNFNLDVLAFSELDLQDIIKDTCELEEYDDDSISTSKEIDYNDLPHDKIKLNFFLGYDEFHAVKDYLSKIDEDLNKAIVKVCCG